MQRKLYNSHISRVDRVTGDVPVLVWVTSFLISDDGGSVRRQA